MKTNYLVSAFLLGLSLSTSVFSMTLGKKTPYDACFTPSVASKKCDVLVSAEIIDTNHELLIQAYHLTNKKIIDAIITKAKLGAKVFIILDKSAINEAVPFLQNHILVYIDNRVRIAHNKVIIIDDQILITGSFNFTDSAQQKNAENLLVIDNRDIANLYRDNFFRRLRMSIKAVLVPKKTKI